MLSSPTTPSPNTRQGVAAMVPRMTKRRVFISVQLVLVFALAVYLTFGSHGLAAVTKLPAGLNPWKSGSNAQDLEPTSPPSTATAAPAEPEIILTPEEKKAQEEKQAQDDRHRGKTAEEIEKEFDENEARKKLSASRKKLATERVEAYIPAIMNADDTSVERMWCPKFNETRYQHLKASKWNPGKKYFFALNLRQCHYVLPRLLGSIVEAMRFVGPENCVLSIVEGRSDDGTAEILMALRPELEALGATYYYLNSDINPSEADRIERLAQLRNMALQPMINSRRKNRPKPADDAPATKETAPAAPARFMPRSEPPEQWGANIEFANDAVVAFINDVAICAEDILELLHQRVIQEADMTCAMDWSHIQDVPTFYDEWVARQINGDSFFDIPDDKSGSFARARYLFPDDLVSRERFEAGRAVHVFACWNGAVTFRAEPVMSEKVKFRDGREGECRVGEPTYFCKDLWWHGYGKIAIVPTVNLEYNDTYGAAIKKRKGYVSDWVKREHREKLPLQITWQRPPEKVLCMPGWTEQYWVPWNETLA
ncbi:hypothetical protein RB601_006118 [Gaeumannomyces tritici]